MWLSIHSGSAVNFSPKANLPRRPDGHDHLLRTYKEQPHNPGNCDIVVTLSRCRATCLSGAVRTARRSHYLVFVQIAGVIEAAGLQIGAGRPDFGKGCFGEDLGGNVVDRAIGDFMDEADVLVDRKSVV